jgi:LacI family transcriptional regulator
LSEQIKVNRRTIRRAVQALSAEGLVCQIPRKGNRILQPGKTRTRRLRETTVALLLPERTTPQPFSFEEILASLQNLMLRDGIRLVIKTGKHYFRKNPSDPLRDLVRENPADCWILRFANGRVQNWFAQNGHPAIVWGRLHPGISLPSISVDLAAMAKHAASTLLRLGHRRIGLLSERDKDINLTRDNFRETISGRQDVELSILEHDADSRSVRQVLQRSLKGERRPTAFFITRTYGYVSAFSLLFSMGLYVPRDLSLLCRDYDPLFPFLCPEPAHFRFRDKQFATQLFDMINRTTRGEILLQPHIRLLPEFVPGKSLSALPARS